MSRLGDLLLAIAILGLLALVVARLERFNALTPEGTASVRDGDSLDLAGERIRLHGIDAPEYHQMCRKDGADYACGRLARAALDALVAGRPVACTGWERDRYGRLLATCTVAGTELNREQVVEGWAVAFGGYAAEEAVARRDRRGVWAGDFERPSDWRISHGGLTETPHDWWATFVAGLRRLWPF